MSWVRNIENKIAKGTSLPIYRQLKEIIKGQIGEGEFKPGDRLPTEYELCEEYAISRAPVRQALAELVNEGLLYRQQGSGTFVNHVLPVERKRLRVMVSEDQWIPPLRKAVKLYSKDRQGEDVALKVETLGRPQLHAKILSAVGRGDAPDLALIDWAWVAEFANLHFLKRLDWIDPEWVNAFKADLFPAFVDRSTPSLYGVQPEANVSVIWYRKDWFAAEGLLPPQRWDELVLAAEHFKRFVRFPLAFAGGRQAGETTTYQLLPFLWSTGGGLFAHGKVALDGRAVSALSFLVDLVHRYRLASPDVVSFDWDKPARLFAEGNAALSAGGSYEKPLIQEISGWNDAAFREKVGCISIPAGPGGEKATVAGGMVYVIFRQTRDEKLAFEVLKRVASPSLMREFCTRTGRSPTRISVVAALDEQEGWFSRRVSELLHSAPARLDIPEYDRVSEQFQLMVENAVSTRLSPQEAVSRAREIIEALISQAKPPIHKVGESTESAQYEPAG